MAYLLTGLMGLALGSFLNVVITRLPRGEWFWGRSRCPSCQTQLAWYDIFPLLSFLWLKGRCRTCGAPIPWRYPAVELVSAALMLALWARFPGSPVLLAYAPFSAALVALSAIDLEHRLLPDAITLPGIGLGLALALILRHLSFTQAALGAAAGWALFALIGWIYERRTGELGMGGGDVKLIAMIGAFLGIKSLPVIIFVSAALGTMAGIGYALKKHRWRPEAWRRLPIPYGPFLALAALLYLFGGTLLP
jgi:leader peptidase (prepilin peptidase)/N-methyltransferase